MRSICFAFLIMMSNQASAWTEKVFDEFSETGQWAYVFVLDFGTPKYLTEPT